MFLGKKSRPFSSVAICVIYSPLNRQNYFFDLEIQNTNNHVSKVPLFLTNIRKCVRAVPRGMQILF